MATTASPPSPSPLSFLHLPTPIRHRIYESLLAPRADDGPTVVMYSLHWPWLANPSNTTFGGLPQLDLCRCPQQQQQQQQQQQVRTANPLTTTPDHMYTRYACHGPRVLFQSGRDPLWLPSDRYPLSGPINFLRPASRAELRRRPNANVLGTCRAVYEEALPFLYGGRVFQFVSGPCPRGRYAAYAASTFFARLSPRARRCVTGLEVLVVPHEEDWNAEDVPRAYGELAAWVGRDLQGFEMLRVVLFDEKLAEAVGAFEGLFEKKGVKVCVQRGKTVEECDDAERFWNVLRVQGRGVQKWRLMEKLQAEEGDEEKAILLAEPEVLLSKWRGKRKLSEQGTLSPEDDDWSDALLTPASTSTEQALQGDGWEVL